MQSLTPAGQETVNDLCQRYGLSQDAVVHMLVAVNNGGGRMAQFYCPELGGGGQWMRGGMTMVGDMFNHGLKTTVDNLCNELSNALATLQIFPATPAGSGNGNQWWPGELGNPFSSGAQNKIRYAVFPQRLAMELNGEVTVYDTLDHSIGGVSQQQGGDGSLSFSSQFGTVSVSSLPIVSGGRSVSAPQTNFATPAQGVSPLAATTISSLDSQASKITSSDDVIDVIEKLARLRDAGALTAEEFNSKKSELLGRL